MVALQASAAPLAPYAIPLLLLALGSAGWFVRRRITLSGHAEKLDLAAKLLDVRSKLRSPDLTTAQIENILSTAGIERSMLPHFMPGTEGVSDIEDDEPSVLSTTAAMSARLVSQLAVLEAKIEQLMVDVEILSYHNAAQQELDADDRNSDHIRKMHRSWLRYRKSSALSVAEDYRGGTIAGAIYFAEEIRLSEVFLTGLEDRLKSLKL